MEARRLRSRHPHLRGHDKQKESPHIHTRCRTPTLSNEGRSVWHFLYRNMQYESLTVNFSRKMVLAQFVIPAKAGIQILCFHCTMDAHFRGHDIFFLKLSQHSKNAWEYAKLSDFGRTHSPQMGQKTSFLPIWRIHIFGGFD